MATIGKRTKGLGRFLVALTAIVVFCGASVACGGPQQPPAEGECREWREWVPPQEDAEGEWQSGYCRDSEDQQ